MKIQPSDRMTQILEEYRDLHQTIVFTNGCFDLLHPGHVYCLFEARKQGDALVVGMNSDLSVQRLKGPARPIIPEHERAETLAAFYFVDFVVLFEEETPLELILKIRPDVLVKGGDYREDEVVGRREVEGWGGRLYRVPTLPGFSSTGIIQSAGQTR